MRAVLWHIQSEQSPIYRAAWRPSRVWLSPSWLMLLLLLSIPLVRLFEVQSGVPFFIYRDQALIGFGLLGTALISLLPYSLLAALPAAGIARLRLVQTWEMFLLTPSAPNEVVTACAAAALRPQWRLILGLGLLGAVFGVLAAVAAAFGLAAKGEVIWAGVLALLGVLCMPYARLQESAICLLIGVQVSDNAPRLAFILGTLSGMAARLALPILALGLSGQAEGLSALIAEGIRLTDLLPTNVTLLATVTVICMALLLGEFALIAFLPSLPTAVAALLIFTLRGRLSRWLVQRAESI